MKKLLYFRLLIFSILGALSLSLLSLFCLVQLSEMVVEDYRYGYLLYTAKSIEKTAETTTIQKVNLNHLPAAPVKPKKDTISLLKFTEIGSSPLLPSPEIKKGRNRKKVKPEIQKVTGPSLWLVSEGGEIISKNTPDTLPLSWKELPRPKKVHDIAHNKGFLLKPKIFTVKLDTIPETYLVSHNESSLFQGPFLWIQGIHTFITAALAVFLALSICFYYLRRKSLEARKVLAQLESGDLKARFEIKRFDEFGNLILDFNRMANEIERLVKRVNDTEASRSNLLQELGHDLRTPLTSLNTSFEALQFHYHKMTEEDREEIFSMIGADIRYFRDLLEKLTIIATIDEPNYKTSSEKINLTALLDVELRNRQSAIGSHINWEFVQVEKNNSFIYGDYHLVTRLFKNAFDNASRFAKSGVKVKLQTLKDRIEVSVIDDGPGLTPEALSSFGKRRERRELINTNVRDFSLGLGSVIMKTIAEVHDGTLNIANVPSKNGETGACLKVVFVL